MNLLISVCYYYFTYNLEKYIRIYMCVMYFFNIQMKSEFIIINLLFLNSLLYFSKATHALSYSGTLIKNLFTKYLIDKY